MMKYIKLICVFLFLSVFIKVQGQDVMLFTGGPLYHNLPEHSTTIRQSGFNTIVFWSLHVSASGDFILNDVKLITNGQYVGNEDWPSELAKFKKQPSSVNRFEFSVGSWGVPDFENIKNLILKEGPGPASALYKNFQKLKEITGVDAIDFDDESCYDVNSTVELSKMLVKLGFKITLCPYTKKEFWQSVFNQVHAAHPNAVDRVYLQCYDGGSKNTPEMWNPLFEGLNVTPGLWASNGDDCAKGKTSTQIGAQLRQWKSEGINGGFVWFFDDIIKCPAGGSTADYAKAIQDAF